MVVEYASETEIVFETGRRGHMNKSMLLEYMEEQSKTFADALEKESDRALGIVAVCWFDNLLEKLIRASFIKDPQVGSLFKDDHILQTFSAKVNIAYYSGLIPRFMHHDLKLMGEIRNRFAHEAISELRFSHEMIAGRINNCELRPKTLDDVSAPRMKFIIIVTQIGALLIFLEHMLSRGKPPKLMEFLKLDEMPWEEIALTKTEIRELLSKASISSESSTPAKKGHTRKPRGLKKKVATG